MKYLIIILGVISCGFSFGQDTASADVVFTDIEAIVPATYPGGEEARQKFFRANLVYPEEAKKAKIEGSVMVHFIIETDSSVSNIKVVKDIGYGCGEEAARLVSLMKWKPAEQQGKLVRMKVGMPIKFRLP